jgi:hypothetical protein
MGLQVGPEQQVLKTSLIGCYVILNGRALSSREDPDAAAELRAKFGGEWQAYSLIEPAQLFATSEMDRLSLGYIAKSVRQIPSSGQPLPAIVSRGALALENGDWVAWSQEVKVQVPDFLVSIVASKADADLLPWQIPAGSSLLIEALVVKNTTRQKRNVEIVGQIIREAEPIKEISLRKIQLAGLARVSIADLQVPTAGLDLGPYWLKIIVQDANRRVLGDKLVAFHLK